MYVIICIGASVIAATITTKALAIHYFKIVDGYVKDICNETEKSNKETLTIIHKLSQIFGQEE